MTCKRERSKCMISNLYVSNMQELLKKKKKELQVDGIMVLHSQCENLQGIQIFYNSVNVIPHKNIHTQKCYEDKNNKHF